MTAIPDSFKDLFQKKAFANLATVNSDGTPQVTPVWVDTDGTHVRFEHRQGAPQGEEPAAPARWWRCR